MYKVFIENRAVIFRQSDPFNTGISYDGRRGKGFRAAIMAEIVTHAPGSEVGLYFNDPVVAFDQFFRDHKRISAAGGLVVKDGNLLFMKRFGMWDLPKGKLEKSESIQSGAIREVEEECGLNGVKITQPMNVTLHTYVMNGKKYLKTTYWFAMECEDVSCMKPQEEEGITELHWFTADQLIDLKKQTYLSIAEVIESYLLLSGR